MSNEPKRDGEGDELDRIADQIDGVWRQHREDLANGQFWADRIKQLRDQPEARLQLAVEHLPLPGAFREAAIALRALIRGRRKAKRGCEDLLKRLYELAAVESFFYATPYSREINLPAHNIAETVRRDEWQLIAYDYPTLGYRKLSLLTKSDCKWLVEAWGEPKQHTIARALNPQLWETFVTRWREVDRRRTEKFRRDLQAPVGTPPGGSLLKRLLGIG